MSGGGFSRGVPPPPRFETTVASALAATARRAKHAEALAAPYQQVRYTYSELDRCVDELAAVLLEGGLLLGDRVGLWSAARAEWFLVQYAAARIGATVVPIAASAGEAVVEHVVRDSGCGTLFAASSYRSADRRGAVERIRPRVPTLEHVVFLGSPAWEQLRAAGRRAGTSAVRRRETDLRADHPAAIRYDSAAPGAGTVMTHRELLTQAGGGDVRPVEAPERVAIDTEDAWAALTASVAATTQGACIAVPGPTVDGSSV